MTGDRRCRKPEFPGGRREPVQFRDGDEGADGGKAIHVNYPEFTQQYMDELTYYL
jgi:hypothetical protein